MSGTQKPQRVLGHLPQNNLLAAGQTRLHYPAASSSAIKIYRDQSTETKEDHLVCEMSTKTQDIPSVKLDWTEDKSNALPESTAQKLDSLSFQSGRTNLTVQHDGISRDWLRTSESMGSVKTDAMRETRKDTKEDVEQKIGRNKAMAARPASAQGFFVPHAASDFTFRQASPLDKAPLTVNHPSSNKDKRPFLDISKPVFDPNTSITSPHPVRPSNGASQHHKIAAVAAEIPFISSPQEPCCSCQRQEARRINGLDQNFQPVQFRLKSDQSQQNHRGSASLSASLHREQTSESSFSSNNGSRDAASYDLSMEARPVDRAIQPEMRVSSVGGDIAQLGSALEAAKQGHHDPKSHQLLCPPSIGSVSYNSIPSTMPNTPTSRRRQRRSNASEAPIESRIDHSASVPAGPRWKSKDYFDSDSPLEQGSDSEEGSPSLVEGGPSPGYDPDSVSGAVILRPLPGPLEMFWTWTSIKRRNMMLPAFFWIVRNIYPNLKKRERTDGYIYAFKCKDIRAKDFVKIGVTVDIEKRMNEHRSCYGEFELIYPLESERFDRVNHALRVERLVHAELVEHGMWLEQCPGNRFKHKSHGEWFDVEERHAIAVIRKWSKWISSSPYEEKATVGISENNSSDGKGTSKQSLKAKPPSNDTPPVVSKTEWRLRALEPDVAKKVCWPLDLWASPLDGSDIDEVATGMRRITVS